MTIVEFLSARLDDDEREARVCLGRGDSSYRWSRVLAQVAAMRAIVEFHESWPVLVDQPPVVEFTKHTENLAAHMSQRIAWLTNQEYRQRFGDEPPTAPMLRHLAAIWSEHPDYDLAWSPDA